MSRHYAVVVGARPNFVKAASLFHGARTRPDYTFTLVHTGQHFDEAMSKIFFDEMQIPQPDITLDTGGEFHTEKIGRMFKGLNDLFASNRFDGVIVFGDVNSTLAGALAAAKYRHPLIHIEAGLRSHDRRMPEEINRVIIDHLSDLLLTSEPQANENLMREGIDRRKVKQVGNIMIETLERFDAQIEKSPILDELNLKPKAYILATLHRQENTDDPIVLAHLLAILGRISVATPVVIPLHPGTQQRIALYGLEAALTPLRVVPPLGYFDFAKLMRESVGVITDSGGIQEETSHLGVPCATLRDSTERPVTVELGSNKLFPTTMAVDEAAAGILAHFARADFKRRPIPLWDAKVSMRILDALGEL